MKVKQKVTKIKQLKKSEDGSPESEVGGKKTTPFSGNGFTL